MGKNVRKALRPRKLLIVLAVTVLLIIVGASPAFMLAKTAVTTVTNLLGNYLIGQLSYSTVDKLFLSANHYFQQRNYPRAIEKCEELIHRHPGQLNYEQLRQIYALLGLSYGQMGRNEKKLQAYEQMMTLDPAYAHFLKGAAFDSEGSFGQAKRELELAMETTTVDKPLDESTSQIIHDTLKRYSHEKLGK